MLHMVSVFCVYCKRSNTPSEPTYILTDEAQSKLIPNLSLGNLPLFVFRIYLPYCLLQMWTLFIHLLDFFTQG